jgi:chromosome segregation ATPase
MAVVKVAPGVTLNSEHIKDFVEAYEEKRKISQELRALDARAQHGRIPRRRYKVQRKTFELRLETLSQKIAQLKAILRSAGGSYSDVVRQIEAAEVELNEAELSLQNIEVRHEAGEIPLDNYKKQLTDIERRKAKAETTLDGLLLRLRGETR